MENAVQMLKKDHDTVRELFDQYNNVPHDDYESKEDVARELFEQLEIHMNLEEEIFYPAVENAGEEEMVAESVAEHQVVKDLIDSLIDTDASDEEFDAKMKVMQENVDHHLQSEETKMFPFSEDKLENELVKLAKEMATLKETIHKEMAM